MTQYSGKIIRKTPVVPTQQAASGVWTVTDAAAAVENNIWPVAGVPDPISRSVRLRESASAFFSKLFPTSGSSTTWTYSAWVKRGSLATVAGDLLRVYYTSTYHCGIYFNATGNLNILQWTGSAAINLQTSQVFRDPSAWYHIVVAVDSTQATSSNRVKLYVNGVQVTAFGTATYPPLNSDTYMCSGGTWTHTVGKFYDLASTYYYDGYMTEANFVDGQALTPSSFGTTDAFTGAWVPMAYTGTYGTTGWYMNFKDNTSTTTLGYDYSGNSNNWTANNISLTAGVTYDSMLDVPTPWVGYNTDGGASVTRGNYCTLNPLAINSNARGAITNGNLTASLANLSTSSVLGSFGMSSGKWYWEITQTYNAQGLYVGIDSNPFAISTTSSTIAAGGLSTGYGYYNGNGQKINSNVGASYGTAWYTSGQTYIIGVAFDADNGTLAFYLNGTSQGTAFTGLTSGPYYPSASDASGSSGPATVNFNFGQRPFTYTPPAGFTTLCTTNLPEPTIKLGAQYMAATTYTGTGAAQSIVNSGNNTTATTFQPDFVWFKSRNNASNNGLFDSVRGGSKLLISDSADAEYTGTYLSSFNSNGVTIGATASSTLNASGYTYIGWQWKAAGSSVSNTSGSITSTVNAGTTQGFSVVTYTGTGANATVGHGLGVAPKMVIVKSRSLGANGWPVYHSSVGNLSALVLNSTGASNTNIVWWNNTSPTSSVFTVGTNSGVNANAATYVAYCFAEVAGYSKFGSYTGNGSADGPFVYLGFRPRYLMVKRTDSADNWIVVDTSRNAYNVVNEWLFPNVSDSTYTYSNPDILSNGFKQRNSGTGMNASGGTYIYMAFAENPFKYSNAR